MHFDHIVRDGFIAALAAGDPDSITKEAYLGLPEPPNIIIALGKAAVAMAAAVRAAGYDGKGLVITNDENYRQIPGFDCIASAHPVPDERGIAAAIAVENIVRSLNESDHLLLLISGGGSALVPAPAAGITLAQKIRLNDALLSSGLDIDAMNIVRRLFSRLKGGQLARLAAPASITQFLLSDVPSNLPESIASGPAVADPVPFEDALALIRANMLDQLDFVMPHLDAIVRGEVVGPVRCGDAVLDKVNTQILASNEQCRAAASRYIQHKLPQLRVISTPGLDGEASQMGRDLAELMIEHHAGNETPDKPFGFVAGGETTVKLDIDNPGKGGRSQELALAFASVMHTSGSKAPKNWSILAGGTDGRDGPTDAAGGLISALQHFNSSAAIAALSSHNSYEYLKTNKQLLMVGSTGTNLADLVLFIAQSN